MRSSAHRRLLVTTVLLAACGEDAGLGTARIHLLFEGESPAIQEGAGLTARVEERGDRSQAGPLVVSLEGTRVPEGPLSPYDLGPVAIPDGEQRVVVVELRSAAAPDRLLYSGLSEPFAIHAGDALLVPVHLQPASPPLNARLQIASARGGFVASPEVTLRLIPDRAIRVRLSTSADFPKVTTSTVELAGLEVDPAVPGARILSWNLDQDLATPCIDSDHCPRAVFGRFIDAEGYESATRTASVTLDTRAPRVIEESVRIELEPPAGLLRRASRARPGTRVTLTFMASEVLAEAPQVTTSGGASIMFEPCQGSGDRYRCALTVPDLPPEEVILTLTATATDLAGNQRRLILGGLHVDSFPPAAPDTETAERIVLSRAPWGSEVAPGLARYEIAGSTGAAEPGTLIVALDRPDLTSALELARTGTLTAQDGSFAGLLLGADAANIFLVAVDQAGNVSDATPAEAGGEGAAIKSVRWLVGFNDRAPSPHRVDIAGFASRFRQSEPVATTGVSGPSLARLSVADDQVLTAHPRALWRERTLPAVTPEARSSSAMALDRIRGKLVLFGGLDGTNALAGTLEWDGAVWERAGDPAAAPPPRFGHALVFDNERGVCLLFGGDGTGGLLDDTWTWDGAHWLQLTPAHTPAPRANHAMAYDASRGVVVLFGGRLEDGQAANDTWRWDGVDWVEEQPTAPPPARQGHALTYDPTSQTVVLFGGEEPTARRFFADTWVWNGTRWLDRTSSSTTAPSARRDAALAFDPSTERVVLFGGVTASNGMADGGLWTFDGRAARWRPLLGSPVRPPPRGGSAIAESPEHGLVLFGGRQGVDDLGDLWQLTGDWFVELTPGTLWPPARRHSVMAWDPLGQRLVMFGGQDAAQGWLSDAWSWDGSRWASLGGAVPELEGPSLAVDPVRQRLVLIGAPNGATSLGVWELAGDVFIARTSSNAAPIPRELAGAAPDPRTGEILLYGGVDRTQGAALDQLVAWNGTGWRSVAGVASGPGARFGQSFVPGPALGLATLFGGRAIDRVHPLEAWTWDGARWQGPHVAPNLEAPGRWAAAVASDPRFGRTWIFGGAASAPPSLADLWAWDGIRWVELDPAGILPSGRVGASLAFDERRQRAVLFAGVQEERSPAPKRDLWELRQQPDDVPAIEVQVDFGASGLDRRRVTRLSITTRVGAQAPDGLAGAELWLWDAREGAWSPIDGHRASVHALEPLNIAVEQPARYVGGDGVIAVRLRPGAGQAHGHSAAEIALDFLSIAIDELRP